MTRKLLYRPRFGTPFWFRGLGSIAVVCVLWLAALSWPVGYLGYVADGATGTVIAVMPHTEASRAHLRVGDQIIAIYGQPWDAVMARWNVGPLIPAYGQPVHLTVQRGGQPFDLALTHVPPSAQASIVKATNLLLALVCVTVGVLLGTARRHDTAASFPVALFWLALGTVIGCYVFAAQLSVPLQVLVQCLLIFVLLPASALIHLHYPMRFVTTKQRIVARNIALGWAGCGTLVYGTGLIWRPFSAAQLLPITSTMTIIAVMGSLVGAITILWRAYRRTTIAHVRRQIRLIATASVAVACFWVIFFSAAYLNIPGAHLFDQAINSIVVVIPLAYLVNGLRPDLYDLDRRSAHLVAHLLTAAVLVSVVASIKWSLRLSTTADILWAALALVLCYHPLFRGVQSVQARWQRAETNHAALDALLPRLSQTLDEVHLIAHMHLGINAAFGNIPIAWYRRSPEHADMLTLHMQERMRTLPRELAAGALTTALVVQAPLTSARELLAHVGDTSLQDDEHLLLWGSDAVLWCPIVHPEGQLLGLLLLGRRTNIDPYRSHDLQVLRRVLLAAALAFTNSATYQQRCEAEATIRALYQALQESQDRTAAAIAREIHDEVLNVNVRLNIQALHHLLRSTVDADLRKELKLLLEGEQNTARSLRMLCEELHPTGLDDPMGLPSVLRVLIAQTCAGWMGERHLMVEGDPIPIAPRVQREMQRIVREAITNAIKHADPSCLTVILRYPSHADPRVTIVVRDDGHGITPAAHKPGRLGVRNMRERAQMIGAALSFEGAPAGGTAVRLVLSVQQEASDLSFSTH